jgi:hypothetical protein
MQFSIVLFIQEFSFVNIAMEGCNSPLRMTVVGSDAVYRISQTSKTQELTSTSAENEDGKLHSSNQKHDLSGHTHVKPTDCKPTGSRNGHRMSLTREVTQHSSEAISCKITAILNGAL